jgi:hypothetical protein
MKNLMNIFSGSSENEADNAAASTDEDVKVADQGKIPDEVNAAIAMTLLELDNEVHDVENTVLTISRTQRPYSPWSSKIYGLNQVPNFIPHKRR